MNPSHRFLLAGLAALATIPAGMATHEYVHCLVDWTRGETGPCTIQMTDPRNLSPTDQFGNATVTPSPREGGELFGLDDEPLAYAAQHLLPIGAAILTWKATA